MGIISRKIFPACGSMCVCCPALRSRSRQPVKRYKKLLADIFPKSPDGQPNDRKIAKLCEYASKNPFRIPKIAKYLEERCYKELRHGHIKLVNVVTDTYKKLLSVCKEQMVYFAGNLLNVASELLDDSKQDSLQILGCQTLTQFIYNQRDSTYAHNIEKFAHKVCKMAEEIGEEHQKRYLRASSLQCLSAMVWFMAEFSYNFATFNEIINAVLVNYELDAQAEDDARESHHNWVDEVVRHEGRAAAAGNDASLGCITLRPRPEIKDPSLLTREETETPKVWAQICIQRMVELAKESTTMRRVLDPMFIYFDSRQHWVPREEVAVSVLSDMSYMAESSGNQQLILAAVIRHLDHKNVAHNSRLKSYIVQIAASLARLIRSGTVLAELCFVSDLCRHLRKSFQATHEMVGEQELNLNIMLQNSIEDCLLEIAKGVGDPQPLFDMMAITLEKIPSSGLVARATMGSLIILAHMTSSVLVSSPSQQQVFPEALLVQLLKVMLHPNVEARVGAHQIFSALLVPSFCKSRTENEPRTWHSNNASASASISALLDKLRREKGDTHMKKNDYSDDEDIKGKDNVEEDWKHARPRKSPNFYALSSIIDRKTASNMSETEPYMMKLSEDQIVQLLSAFWIQATLPDNLPSNIEAISHSYVLTLISSRFKNLNDNLIVRFFQLPLSLMNLSLGSSNGMLLVCQRSTLVLSAGMLMCAAKIYHISELNDFLKSLIPHDVDPYLGISDGLQVLVRPDAELRDYGSGNDSQHASSLLRGLREKMFESNKAIVDILARNISAIAELDEDDLARQLLEPFTPDDAFMFGPQSMLDLDSNQMTCFSSESLSFDEDIQGGSFMEDDARSEPSVADLSRFIPKIPPSPSISHVISIGQLLESALEVAGQVAATSVSSSPLPYDAMANHCEALTTGTRRKLSNWLVHENIDSNSPGRFLPIAVPGDGCNTLRKITSSIGPLEGALLPRDPCSTMRLPPASPFDNFLKAAGC